MLCSYKNIFGKPYEGVHSIRIPIIDLAFIDVFFTVIAAYIISKYFEYNFVCTLLFLFLLAIFIHYIFCVNTRLNVFLNL